MEETKEEIDVHFENLAKRFLNFAKGPSKPFMKESYHEYMPSCILNKNSTDVFHERTTNAVNLTFQYPKNVYSEPFCVHRSFKDPMVSLVKEKHKFIEELNKLKRNYQAIENKDKEKEGIYSIYVAECAEFFYNDPDRHFKGQYDWYFNGSSMSIINSDNETFLVHSSGENLETLNTVPLILDKYPIIQELDRTRLSTIAKKIYEIIPDNSHNTFATRHRDQVYIYEIEDSEAEEKTTLVSCIPITSAAFNGDSKKMMISNVAHDITEWNIETKSKTVIKSSDNKFRDNWNSIKQFGNANTYLYVNRNNVEMIDPRVKKNEMRNTILILNEINELEPCEFLSCVQPGLFDNQFYLGTTHRLLNFDVRNISRTSCNVEPNICWNHQFESPPTIIMPHLLSADQEIVLVGNYISNNVKICQNEKILTDSEDVSSIAYSWPVRPYTILDSYHLARAHGKCINPILPIKYRTLLSNAGWQFQTCDNNLYLFNQNSVGDVFIQLMNSMPNNQNIPLKMEIWSNCLEQFRRNDQKIFKATDVFDCSKLISELNKVTPDVFLESDKKDGYASSDSNGSHLEEEMAKLQEYTDLLAPKLLEHWANPDITLNESMQTERVAEWLNNYCQTDK